MIPIFIPSEGQDFTLGEGLVLAVVVIVFFVLLVSLMDWAAGRDFTTDACYRSTYVQCLGMQVGWFAGLLGDLW